jgi:hypothetical protein
MYLWHWPIFVFGTEAGLMDQVWQRFVGIGLTIVLAIATYFLVEKPFLSIPIKRVVPQSARSTSPFKGRQIQLASATAAVVGFIVVLGVTYPTALGFTSQSSGSLVQGWVPPKPLSTAGQEIASATDGSYDKLFTQRQELLSKSIKFERASEAQKQSFLSASATIETGPNQWSCTESAASGCSIGNVSAKRLIVVVGGSYAAQWSSAFGQISRIHPDVQVQLFSVATCNNSTRLGEGQVSDANKADCIAMHNKALTFIKNSEPDLVVLASGLDNLGPSNQVPYLKGMRAFTTQVKEFAKRTVLLGVVPHYPDPKTCLNKNLSNLRYCGSNAADVIFQTKFQNALGSQSGVRVVDPLPWLCIHGRCPAFVGDTMSVSTEAHINRDIAQQTAPLMYAALFAKK